ncbi:MAG: hypothetical protein ABI446_08680 [Gemmatimonadaceae bacterium]
MRIAAVNSSDVKGFATKRNVMARLAVRIDERDDRHGNLKQLERELRQPIKDFLGAGLEQLGTP